MARKGNRVEAFAYLRTSGHGNVGEDKDSDKRQLVAIEAFAKRAGYDIVGKYYDAKVKGADHIDTRPGFAAMLEKIAGNGVRTIIVEAANRFARDLIVQEVGYNMLKERGIDLIAADSPTAFLDEGPTAVLIRQVLGAVAQFEKSMTVAKLRGARERKKTTTGQKVEGRKSHAEVNPELVEAAKRLRGDGLRPAMSLRAIATELERLGFVNEHGRAFGPQSVANMLAE